MTISGVNAVNVEQIAKNLEDAKKAIQDKETSVQGLFDTVNADMASMSADYADDNSINGTAGHTLASTDMTMDKVNDMEYNDIVKLLEENSTDSKFYTDLQKQQEDYNKYVEQFTKLQEEIDKLESDLTKKLQELNVAVEAQEKAQKNVEDAQKILEEMQAEYGNAISDQNADLASQQATAYSEAMAEFLKQETDNVPENERRSFQDIYKEKVGSISVRGRVAAEATSDLEDAKSAFQLAQTQLVNKNALVEEAQVSYNAIKTNFDNKQASLTSVANNINGIQENVNKLEKKIATFNFVQQNKTAIEDVAYEKNPATIEARATIDSANTIIQAKLAEATTAEAAAQAAAKNGDVDAANTEKAKAEAAKQAAIEEQRKADAAKANLRETDAKQAVIGTINTNMAAIDTKLTSIGNAVTSAQTVKTAHETIASATTTVETQLGLAKAAEAAAKEADARGDLTTASAEKAKAEAAKKAAEDAQKAAQAAVAQLEAEQANDKKSVEMAALNTKVSQVQQVVTDITKATANLEAAATREAAGVSYATSVDEVTGETTKDYNKMDLTKMISQAELDLVKANNLDLTEVLPNGYPRFILAKGKDGNFHIYERFLDKKGKPKSELASLARTYASGGGYNIIKMGSGYMGVSGESECAANKYSEVYYLTCVSDDFKTAQYGNTYKKYSTYSPLSLDLNGDGVKTSDKVVDFDIDGDGQMDKINDSADAVLVFDKNKDGVAGADGSECFGNNTDLDGDGKADGYKDGFEALKALAMKENLVNGKDDNVLDEKDLKFLEMTYGLKLKAEGYNSEAQSLGKFGITQINLATTGETTMQDNFDGKGNQLMTQEGATFVQNGATKEYADIWHRKLPFLNATSA